MKTGLYDICVFADAFTAVCRKVHAEEGKTIEYEVKLPVDPLVTSLLGDRF
jgi:hypothetical protein